MTSRTSGSGYGGRLGESGIMDAIPDDAPAGPLGVGEAGGKGGSGDVGPWLDMAVRLCRLPEKQGQALRDELADHLGARVDDLLVRGMDERRAAEKAIDELGDAALFAQRYRSQRSEPLRRKVMNGVLLCGVGAALTLSVASFTMDQARPANMYVPGDSMYTQVAGDDVRISLSVSEAPLREVLESLANQLDNPMYAHWESLAGLGAGAEKKVTLSFNDVSMKTAMRFLNDEVGVDMGRIEHRINDGLLEFATRDYFDRYEQVIVTYELGQFADYDYEEVTSVITSMVEFDSWVENGGEAASLTIVGDTMFVKGPGRVQRGVRWVLRQLLEGGEVLGQEGAEGEDAGGGAR